MKTASRTPTHTHTPLPTSLSTQTIPTIAPDHPCLPLPEDGGQSPQPQPQEQEQQPHTHSPHPPATPQGGRPKRRVSYFPAPKSRSKPWQRERGPRGFIKRKKVEKEEEEDLQLPIQTPEGVNGCRRVCAFCAGAPSGVSRCVCPVVPYCVPVSSLCAFCLGAPTGSYCTCANSELTLLNAFHDML